MPRPCKRRRCRAHEGDRVFKPRSVPMYDLAIVPMPLSELEALRLCDYEGFDQAEAGERMCVSRGTIQRLLARGRARILDFLIHGKALRIEEGDIHEDLYPEPGRPRTRQ